VETKFITQEELTIFGKLFAFFFVCLMAYWATGVLELIYVGAFPGIMLYTVNAYRFAQSVIEVYL